MKKKSIHTLLLLAFGLILFSCQKEEPEGDPVPGKVLVYFVHVNGVKSYTNTVEKTFTVILPTETDFSSMELSFTTEATTILAGDHELGESNTGIDLSQPLTVRFIKGGFYEDYTIIVKNTGLPVVRIETPGK